MDPLSCFAEGYYHYEPYETCPHPFCVEQRKAKPSATTVLSEAEALVGNGGERNDSYDHPRNNFEKIAKVWSVLLGIEVTPRAYAQCMVAMKLVRDSHKNKRDNLVDIAGYVRCIERMDEK